MKQVTRYESDDGVLFDTEGACKRHEHKQWVIKKIREGIESACIAEVESHQYYQMFNAVTEELKKLSSGQLHGYQKECGIESLI